MEALIEEARRRARRRRLFCAAVVALAALVAVTVFVVFDRAAQSQAVSPSTAPPALAADATTSKIAFTREPLLSGYGGVLYVMNSDGSGKRRVSIGLAWSGMRWSPDGQKIAYTYQNAFVMNADGSERRQLTSGPMVGGLAWSPDGRAIAFTRSRDPSLDLGFYVMNADGSEQRLLTRYPAWGDDPTYLAWSPRGDKIAFVSRHYGNAEISVMNADGSGRRRLTHDTVRDSNPVWSPDGRRIAYESAWQVSVMNADGSGQRRLTRSMGLEVTVKNEKRPERNYSIYAGTNGSHRLRYTGLRYGSRAWAEKVAQTIRDRGVRSVAPAWSPDGRRIVFERRIGHATDCRLRGECDTAIFEVHVMNADGTGQQMLTGPQMLTPGGATPAWSPDGKRIAFVSRRDGNEAEIYVINPDGSGLQNLTRTPDWNETSFVWSPGQKN